MATANTAMTPEAARERLINGLFPPVRRIVVGIDGLEAEARTLREKHGAAILPDTFWTRLGSLVRARDTYLEEVEQ